MQICALKRKAWEAARAENAELPLTVLSISRFWYYLITTTKTSEGGHFSHRDGLVEFMGPRQDTVINSTLVQRVTLVPRLGVRNTFRERKQRFNGTRIIGRAANGAGQTTRRSAFLHDAEKNDARRGLAKVE